MLRLVRQTRRYASTASVGQTLAFAKSGYWNVGTVQSIIERLEPAYNIVDNRSVEVVVRPNSIIHVFEANAKPLSELQASLNYQLFTREKEMKFVWKVFNARTNEPVDIDRATSILFGNEADDSQKGIAKLCLRASPLFQFHHNAYFAKSKELARTLMHRRSFLDDSMQLNAFYSWVNQRLSSITKNDETPSTWRGFNMPKPALVRARAGPLLESARQAYLSLLEEIALLDPARELMDSIVLTKLCKPFKVHTPHAAYTLLDLLGHFDYRKNIHMHKALKHELISHPPTIGDITPNELPHDTIPRTPVFTRSYAIDSEDTFEVDDSIGIERENDKTWIMIHIADPTRFIEYGSDMERRARTAISSIYAPDNFLPIFPKKFAEDMLSITGDGAKPALTVRVLLAPDGSVSDYQIFASTLSNVHRISYDQLDRLFERPDSEIALDLQTLQQLASKRTQYRIANGAWLPALPKCSVKLIDDDVQITPQVEGPSQKTVSEMMVLCGEVIGSFCKQNNLPVLYRTQRPPVVSNELKTMMLLYPQVADMMLINWMYPARDETQPNKHHSIGFDTYTRFTSPIRRYSDLLVHYQLKGKRAFALI
jgi:hypothetical protein